MSLEKVESLVVVDLNEFYIEKLVKHSGTERIPRHGSFKCDGMYKPKGDTMADWRSRTSRRELWANRENIISDEF